MPMSGDLQGSTAVVDSPLQVTIWTKRLRAGRLHARVRGAVGQRGARLEACGHRRVAAGRDHIGGCSDYRRTIAQYLQRWFRIGRVVERGLAPDPAHRAWPRSRIARFGSTMPPLSVFARRSTGLLSALGSGLPSCWPVEVVARQVHRRSVGVHGHSRTVWPQRMPRAMSIPVALDGLRVAGIGLPRSPASPISTAYRPG